MGSGLEILRHVAGPSGGERRVSKLAPGTALDQQALTRGLREEIGGLVREQEGSELFVDGTRTRVALADGLAVVGLPVFTEQSGYGLALPLVDGRPSAALDAPGLALESSDVRASVTLPRLAPGAGIEGEISWRAIELLGARLLVGLGQRWASTIAECSAGSVRPEGSCARLLAGRSELGVMLLALATRLADTDGLVPAASAALAGAASHEATLCLDELPSADLEEIVGGPLGETRGPDVAGTWAWRRRRSRARSRPAATRSGSHCAHRDAREEAPGHSEQRC